MSWAVLVAFIVGCFVGAALGTVGLALMQASGKRPPQRPPTDQSPAERSSTAKRPPTK